jgi:hypothetical protein
MRVLVLVFVVMLFSQVAFAGGAGGGAPAGSAHGADDAAHASSIISSGLNPVLVVLGVGLILEVAALGVILRMIHTRVPSLKKLAEDQRALLNQLQPFVEVSAALPSVVQDLKEFLESYRGLTEAQTFPPLVQKQQELLGQCSGLVEASKTIRSMLTAPDELRVAVRKLTDAVQLVETSMQTVSRWTGWAEPELVEPVIEKFQRLDGNQDDTVRKGSVLRITGKNFDRRAKVFCGGVEAELVTVSADGCTIVARVGNCGPEREVGVTVSNLAGASKQTLEYRVDKDF